MKHNKKKFTNKDFTIAIVELTNLVMDNKNHIKMLSDFFFNYLDMKGETEQYTKHMESKVDEILKDSGEGISEFSEEPVQEEKEV